MLEERGEEWDYLGEWHSVRVAEDCQRGAGELCQGVLEGYRGGDLRQKGVFGLFYGGDGFLLESFGAHRAVFGVFHAKECDFLGAELDCLFDDELEAGAVGERRGVEGEGQGVWGE